MQINSVVREEFDHIHTYIHTYTRNLGNVALSIRVTLNTCFAGFDNNKLVINVQRM